MPFIIDEFIVVRDVKITASWSQMDIDRFHSITSGSFGGGFGPFRVRGNYSNERRSLDIKAEEQNGTVTIKEPQVIGFSSIALPTCPNPFSLRTLPPKLQSPQDPLAPPPHLVRLER